VLSLFVLIGAIFSPLAAAAAYLITFEEYSHHGLGRRELVKRSLSVAVAALVFIFVALVIAGWFLDRFVLG